ncbi:hypothetical protein E4T56_gene5763, partial [Termitomyces sp. T112]
MAAPVGLCAPGMARDFARQFQPAPLADALCRRIDIGGSRRAGPVAGCLCARADGCAGHDGVRLSDQCEDGASLADADDDPFRAGAGDHCGGHFGVDGVPLSASGAACRDVSGDGLRHR